MGFELLGLEFAVSKTIENENGIIFSSDILGFLIIGTGILRKFRLGNGIETPPPPPSGPSYFIPKISKSRCVGKIHCTR